MAQPQGFSKSYLENYVPKSFEVMVEMDYFRLNGQAWVLAILDRC